MVVCQAEIDRQPVPLQNSHGTRDMPLRESSLKQTIEELRANLQLEANEKATTMVSLAMGRLIDTNKILLQQIAGLVKIAQANRHKITKLVNIILAMYLVLTASTLAVVFMILKLKGWL